LACNATTTLFADVADEAVGAPTARRAADPYLPKNAAHSSTTWRGDRMQVVTAYDDRDEPIVNVTVRQVNRSWLMVSSASCD
jgi:hypothetical protein